MEHFEEFRSGITGRVRDYTKSLVAEVGPREENTEDDEFTLVMTIVQALLHASLFVGTLIATTDQWDKDQMANLQRLVSAWTEIMNPYRGVGDGDPLPENGR